MTEQELNRQQHRLNEERAYINMQKVVSSMRCPLCGGPLQGYVTDPVHDTLDVKAHIVCTKGCKMIHFEGTPISLYDHQPNGEHVTKASILESSVQYVRKWTDTFFSYLEENL